MARSLLDALSRRISQRTAVEEKTRSLALLTAPRYPLLKPQAKGGARTGKQRAVAQILLLHWATVARATAHQAPGPEISLYAHQLRHGLELLT